jgi:hypothetical protein
MNKFILAASILLVALLDQQFVSATYFVNNGDANCTYPVSLTVSDISCYTTGDEEEEEKFESEYCTFGDNMFISGEITLEENLPSSEMCVTTKVCLFGYVCRTYKETMDVCNAVGVSNEADGTACPNAGTFYFGSTAKIPGRPFMKLGSGTLPYGAFFSDAFIIASKWTIHSRNIPYSFANLSPYVGWGVTVKVLAEDCNQYKNYAFSCQTTFSAVSSEGTSSSSSMMISGAALLGVAAALAIFIQRRRQTAAEDSDDQQQNGFEMMNDKSAISA